VLAALERRLPSEHFLYLGDTARLPYGTKSPGTIRRYAVQAARLLVERGVKALVVACNTASSVALDALNEAYAPLPVFGVVAPGAAAACRASRSGRIAVIATESTVRGGAYQRAILGMRPDAKVYARPCPLLVTLAEEGWVDGPVPEAVVRAYLESWIHQTPGADCLLLGCTHFPPMSGLLARAAGEGVVLVDSAETTASAVAARLVKARPSSNGRSLLATDDQVRFARVGALFLGTGIDSGEVEVVDL
jgi:glutamate racemase